MSGGGFAARFSKKPTINAELIQSLEKTTGPLEHTNVFVNLTSSEDMGVLFAEFERCGLVSAGDSAYPMVRPGSLPQ